MYLCLLLTHLGFRNDFFNWVMGCITTTSISIFINGVATHFFHIQRGLCHRFPLSPLLFLLAAEGLSLMIHDAKRRGELKGIDVVVNLSVTHLLFVDDILLFSNESIEYIRRIKEVLDVFLKATGLSINCQKYSITMEGYPEPKWIESQICYLLK